MEILWPALGIAVIVVFVFYVLAQHWQRILRQQSWTIRCLFDRVQSLEEISNPEWRRRLGEAAPVPLEQVFTFSFRFDDRFWRDAVRLGEDDQKFIREHGSFVGAIKLERWRSHTVATITEVLPDLKATGWQTRALDFYSDPFKGSDAISLWELALSRPSRSAERPPSLELLLRANALELRGRLLSATQIGNGAEAGDEDVLYFRVPLDTARLAAFRSHDPADTGGNGDADGEGSSLDGNSWQAFYSQQNDELGIEWQLRLCDLTRKSEWERWKILETTTAPLAAQPK
ncbi:MAG TPA: hypothetical protein VNV41_09570 [Candidatus Acidoferrales bacterium]|jgi:hypothetical protein|nr:hypothetical protein [Candidatus Acidoferrales bacterium]